MKDLNEPGYYKTRLYSRGPFVPIEVFLVRGGFVRFRKGKLYSHMVPKFIWWPSMSDPEYWEAVDPLEETKGGFQRKDFWEPITKEDFEWLIKMKAL